MAGVLDGYYRPISSQNITLGTANVAAVTAVPYGVKVVRLCVSGTPGAFITLNAPATTTAGMYVAPGQHADFIAVDQGDVINAISTAAGGTLNITFMSR